MRFLSIIVVVCFALQSHGQFHRINFTSAIKTCPIQNVQYEGLANWDVFQTTNDQVDGERLPLCEAFTFANQNLVINGHEAGKPIFIKNSKPLDLELSSNKPYNLTSNLTSVSNQLCDCNTQCSIDSCYSLTLVSEGTYDNAEAKDVILLDEFVTNGFPEVNFITRACFLTSKIENQLIKDLYFKFIPNEENELDIELNAIAIFEVSTIEEFGISSKFVNKVIPNEFKITTTYFVTPTFFIEEEGWCCEGTVRVLHEKPGIPSKNNVHTYLLTPEDSTVQNSINLVNSPIEKIKFQRFTELRGAIVAGQSDPNLRHRLVIVNDGDLCLGAFVEIVNQDENEFRFRSGSIDFGNDMACIMFRDQSKFVIEEGAHLDYGHHGHGLVAFFPGTSLEIEKGGSLNFGGHLMLREGDYSKPISIHLGTEQKLKFNAGTKIFPFTPEAQFTIYMEGGLLDIDELDPQYLPYLNIVYPESVVNSKAEYLVYPNPTLDVITISSTSDNFTFDIYDITGRVISTKQLRHQKSVQLDIRTLENGIYFLKEEKGYIHKIIKQ